MKSILKLTSIIIFVSHFSSIVIGQTTAMDFEGNDCNGNQVHLFSDLDAGKAVVLFYYMPNCGSCPPPAQKIQTMANNINANYPGKVKAYAYPYQNSTTCSYSANWVTSNGLSLYTPMDSGAAQVAYYGGFGMPTVVLLGGTNHDVMWVTADFLTSDTTIMRDSILAMLTADIKEISEEISSFEVYPNPTSNILNIRFNVKESSDIAIELIDLEGRKIQTNKIEKIASGLYEKGLDVSEIPNGIYFIKINVNGKSTTEKINIKH